MRLKEKLYNYEQTPPAGAWDKISSALDESHLADQFPSRLYNTEATPPAMAWDKIAASLDADQAPVVTMPRKRFPILRYAAAAVVVGIIAIVVVKLNNSPSKDRFARKKDTVAPGTAPVNTPQGNEVAENNPPVNDLPESTVIAITDKTPARAKKRRTDYSITENIDPVTPIYAYNENTPDLAERYVMLITPNGIIRMSKKLGDIICCVTGEEQDGDCRDQIRKWQEKLAASPVAPAPGNFMDILSLVSSLSEDDL